MCNRKVPQETVKSAEDEEAKHNRNMQDKKNARSHKGEEHREKSPTQKMEQNSGLQNSMTEVV